MDNEILEMTFEYEGRTFKYDPDRITVEMAELAREATEFKVHQTKSTPANFETVIKTKGADWLSIVMSCLLVEYKGDVRIPFNIDIRPNTESWIKQLPKNPYLTDLRRCADDFFQDMQMGSDASGLLVSNEKQSVTEILLQLMTGGKLGKVSEELLPTEKPAKSAIKKAN